MKKINGIKVTKRVALELARATRKEHIYSIYVHFDRKENRIVGGRIPTNSISRNRDNQIIYCKSSSIDYLSDFTSLKDIADTFYRRMCEFAKKVK